MSQKTVSTSKNGQTETKTTRRGNSYWEVSMLEPTKPLFVQCLLAFLFLSFCSDTFGMNIITEVRQTGSHRDNGNETFANDSWMRFGKDILPVMSYSGQWSDGLADGVGELIIGTEWNRPLTDPSTGKTIYYTNFNLPVYKGRFVKGVPTGIATVNSMLTGVGIERDFTNDSLQLMSILSAGRRIATFPSIGGEPVDGPLKMAIYPPMGTQPSKIFFGVIKDGTEQGEWISVPWRATTANGEVHGFKNYLSYPTVHGDRFDCQIDRTAGTSDAPPTLKELMPKLNFPSFKSMDATYNFSNSIQLCNFTSSGWHYQFRRIETNPTTGAVVKYEAISCSDKDGKLGQASLIADNRIQCVVPGQPPRKSKNLLNKIIDEIKRTPGNVKDGILHTINEAGDEFTKFICDAVQKTPGKDCNVTIQGGVVINLPEDKGTTNTTTTTNHHKAAIDASRKSMKALQDSTQGQPELVWANMAADLYSLCVESCNNESKQRYSLSMIQLMNRSVEGAGDGGRNFRRIASFGDDWAYIGNEILSKIPVVSSAYTFYKSAQTTAKFDDALLAIQTMPHLPELSPEGIQRSKVFNDLYKMKMDYLPTLYSAGLHTWEEFITLAMPGVNDIPAKNPYVQFLETFKINQVEFIRAHLGVKASPEAFYDAVIAERMKGIK